ncbi:hypothetical protein GSF22_15195 [Micromonospora echinofusca]|uniref:Erythromycin biosynthesis protein CIII-like C-terminal domain-containing protein n=2 Tax=Micromonospora echinofusca TaxID=47858 RepID=A0ABS3VS27_MICEH|nr:hypothetical protein [Micromonospora echinofusca]
MVVHGTDGDVLPFVRVGRALRARGHDVTVLSHEYYRPAVGAAGLDFVPVDTIAEYEYHLADAAEQADATRIEQFREHFDRTGLFTQLRFEVGELVRRHRPGETVLVGASLSGQSALIAAEATGAPLVCLAHSPFQLLARDRVAWLYSQVLADRIDTARADVGLPPVGDWSGWMSSAHRYVGLWPSWFDRAGTASPPGTPLAGFVLADADQPDEVPPEVARLLADGPPPLLVSGGTGRLLHRAFYRSAVAAISSLGQRALLAVRHRDLVPDPLPPGTFWFPRLPFRAIAPHVAAVVHHGGIGTLGRALASGTPQVILASGLDRPDNADRLARLGLAHPLSEPDWTAEAVAGAVRAALDTPVPARPEVAGAGGADRAAGAIEAVLGGALSGSGRTLSR